jgi:hypothetical protein
MRCERSTLQQFPSERLRVVGEPLHRGRPLVWSLEHAARDWQEAVALADAAGICLLHPDRDALTVLDVVRGNAHDAQHHGWDISRSLHQP